MNRNRWMLLIASLVMTSFLLVSCGATDPGITTAVKSKLAADERTSAMKIDVDTSNKVVTLNGTVNSQAEKSAAEQVARNTDGVANVVNNLTVAAASERARTDGGGEVTVGRIVGDLENYAGKTVTVVADVQEVLGPRAFTLDEDDVLAGGIDNDMMVLSPQAANLRAIENDWAKNKVRVTGTVRAVQARELETEVGWKLDRRVTGEFKNVKAVLVASSVERLQ
jgi:predicted small secreted protein